MLASPPTVRRRPARPWRSARELKLPLVIHQPSYSILNRWVEKELLGVLEQQGVGLHRLFASGTGSAHQQVSARRPRRTHGRRRVGFFNKSMLTETNLANVRALNAIAQRRGQSLAQMAIAWVLRKPVVTSALIGASRWAADRRLPGRPAQHCSSAKPELDEIDKHAADGGLNIWAQSSQSG